MNTDALEKRIIKILGNHSLKNEEINNVENSLNIKFSDIFLKLNKLCSYEYAHTFSFFNFGKNGPDSVIETTLGIRENYQNSENFIVLYLDGAGIVLLNVADEKSPVIWCSVYDIENVFNNLPLTAKHQFFPTFADFFTYLLDEEEEMRREEAAEN